MFSSDFSGTTLRNHTQKNQMSYMFGPHSTCEGPIYYTGDRRVVNLQRIAITPEATPAWVIGDYMLAKSRGEPLTAYEEMVISQPFQSENLKWLREYLRET